MTCCQRCEDNVAKFGVFVMNLIDFLIGSMFLTFGVYLRVQLGSDTDDIHTAWLTYVVLIIGACLLLIVVLSFTSMNLTDCKVGVVVSGYLALFVSMSSLIMAVTSLVVRGDLFNYLDSNGDDIGLSSQDIDKIKGWYSWVIFGLFCSFVLEFIRYKWSSFLYVNYAAVDARYQGLLAQEEDEYEVRINAGRAERAEKYDNLRNHYKNKYATRSDENEDALF